MPLLISTPDNGRWHRPKPPGSAWDTGRCRRAWLADFTEEERRAACRLFKQARGWTVGRGVPDEVTMTEKTFRLWRKLAEFCASI